MPNDTQRPDIDDDLEHVDPDLAQGDEDDDEFEKKLLEMLEAGDDGDEKVFSGPVTEKEVAVISVEDGLDLVTKATTERGTKRRAEILDKSDPTQPPAEGDDSLAGGQDSQPAGQGEDTTPAGVDDDLSSLLEGLDDDRRQKISARVKDADEVMSLFKGRDEQLKMHGVTAKQAMARLIQLNEYAAAKPVEYIAWATAQLAPDKAEEVLMQAAEKLGLKVTRADDDPFEDEEVKRLRDENRRLRGLQIDFGPDAEAAAAAAQAQDPVRVIQDFATAKGADGKPLRPLWDQLKGNVAMMAKTHRETTGQVVTADDLARFYSEAETAMRAALGMPAAAPQQGNDKPAAQPAAPVAGGGAKKAAPSSSVERAKAASKTIDGTGQGASRRPAPSVDASLDDVLRHFAGFDD